MYQLIDTVSISRCTARDLFFINHAVQSAQQSDFHSSLKLGACIVVDRKKFYGGYNQKRRARIMRTSYFSVHAEIHALHNYTKRMAKQRCGTTIYVVRLLRDTTQFLYGNSKPCERCQEYLYRHCVEYIKYTDIVAGTQVIVTMRHQA